MRRPKVYSAIAQVAAGMAQRGVAKSHLNADSDYWYRSIDDVMARLSPLLVSHGLCVLPRVLERASSDQDGLGGALLTHVTLKVAYDLVCVEDGSRHTVKAFGEALDASDKATAKAMSSAFKSAMLQSFCIPLSGEEDGDSATHRPVRRHDPAPVEGWDQWTRDIVDLIGGCKTKKALERVQATHRSALKAVSRERPDLYQSVGRALCAREDQLPSVGRPRTVAGGPAPSRAKAEPKAPADDVRVTKPRQSELPMPKASATHG